MRKPSIGKVQILSSVLCMLAALTACNSQGGTTPTSAGRLNVVEALGLGSSVRIEIMAFDLDNVDPNEEYLPIANITNPTEVEEIVFLLEGELNETPALLCIPEYRLLFYQEDGTQVMLDFSCEDAAFITGGQAVFVGRQFSPPAKFSSRIRSYYEQAVNVPESINLLKAAEFSDVVRLEILEQTLGDGSAEINSLLVIEDLEQIEEVLLAMSGDFALHPQTRCPVDYFLNFTMDDNRTVTFGYQCSGDEYGILRGDQAYFFGQDIHLGIDFVRLIDGIVNP